MSDDDQKVNFIKFVLIGNKEVGKSSIINAFIRNKFLQGYEPTCEIDPQKYSVSNINNFALKIVDTLGTTQFKRLIIQEFENTNFVFIVFDITNKNSFDSINIWINECNLNSSTNNLDLVLIGNKSDLEKVRKVTEEEAIKFAQEKNMKYYETSALTKANIQKIFEESVRSYFQNVNRDMERFKQTDNLRIRTSTRSFCLDIKTNKNIPSGRKKGCC